MNEESFQDYFSNSDYAAEMYGLVEHVCLMNIVHALTLMCLGFFVLLFTRRFKILNERHYWQLGLLSVAITIFYFLPVVLVAMRAWSDATNSVTSAHKGAIHRFYDMLFYILLRSAMGIAGFVLTSLIHLQLYCLVFVMMWCAGHIKEIADKVKKLKDEQAGTYQGLELQGNEEMSERRSRDGGSAAAAGPPKFEVALAEDQIEEESQIIEEEQT